MRVDAVILDAGRMKRMPIADFFLLGQLTLVLQAAVISSGAVSATKSYLSVDTEGAAASDDLDNITDGNPGDLLIVVLENAARIVTLKDGTGNLRLAGDFIFTSVNDTITLIFDGSNWLELGRSVNG